MMQESGDGSAPVGAVAPGIGEGSEEHGEGRRGAAVAVVASAAVEGGGGARDEATDL